MRIGSIHQVCATVVAVAVVCASTRCNDGTTGAADTAPPSVVSTLPAAGAADVAQGTALSVTLSERIDANSISDSTLSLTTGSIKVYGSTGLNGTGTILTFTPASSLTAGAIYVAVLAAGLRDLAGNTLGTGTTWAFTTVPPAAGAPSVTSTDPFDHQTRASKAVAVRAVFSQSIDRATVTSTTFWVQGGGGTVAGAIAFEHGDSVTVLTPSTLLSGGAVYTAHLTPGVHDTAGRPLPTEKVWTFETSSDAVPPSVTSVTPVDGAAAVSTTIQLTASFSEPLDSSTLTPTTFRLTRGGAPVTGTVSYPQGRVVVFAPAQPLAPLTAYTARLTTGIRDRMGNGLAADYTWMFTTGNASDTTPPTVVATSPQNGATGVARSTAVEATFSERLDPGGVIPASFIVASGAVATAGNVVLDGPGTVLTFTPSQQLNANTLYTVRVASLRDIAGNSMAAEYVWTFTTAAGAALLPAPANVRTLPGWDSHAPGYGSFIRMDWDAVVGATTYNIYIRETASPDLRLLPQPAVPYPSPPWVQIVDVAPNVTKWFTLTAVDALGREGARSAEVSGHGNAAPAVPSAPAAPAQIAVTAGTLCKQVRVSWSAVTGATAYRVYRTDYFSNTLEATVTTTSVTFAAPCVGIRCYQVTAVNANGESPRSAYQCGSSMPCGGACPVD